MTPSPIPPEELLSAHHDGELSPPERAELDRLLAETPALRETLDDYRELTALVQSLPRPQAPAELRAGVLQRIGKPAPAPARRTVARRPWIWGLSLAATAALLLVIVNLQSPPHEAVEVAATSEPTSPSGRPSATPQAADAVESAEASTRSAPGSVSGATVNELADAERGGPASGAEAGAFPSTRESAASPTRASMRASGSTAALAGEHLADRLRLDPTHPPASADVLAYVDRVGDETVIVEFDVLDVDETADDMLVLLQRRGVTIVDAADADRAAGDSASRRTSPAASPLVTVYVEATEEQLAGVLDEMLSTVSINDGAAYNAEVAGPFLNGRLRQLQSRYGDARPAESAASAPASPPTPAGSKSVLEESSPPLVASRLPATDDESQSVADETLSQAVRMSIPRAAYQHFEKRSEPVEKVEDSRRTAQAAQQSAGASGASLPAASSSDRPEPVQRVLFVLQETSGESRD